MKTKLVGFFVLFIICASATPLSATIEKSNTTPSDTPVPEIEVLSDDLLRYNGNTKSESDRSDPNPGYYDTSEYLIGSVGVGLIYLESNGIADPNTENWNATEIANVQNQITQAMTWWSNQCSQASMSYAFDVHTGVPTSYEPIIHPSAITDPTYEKLWVSEAMAYLGYTTGDWMQQTRDYVNAMRTALNTDWAFTVFLVDSSNDVGGDFSDGYFAYAYLGGPYVVMTYDNDGWGIFCMNQVMSHETGHIFWATDEYDGYTEFSGYLNAPDNEGSGCLMDTNFLSLSAGTRTQVGWRDTDGDNILDIIDTYPDTVLNPYPQDPTPLQTLTYTGTATEVPYPNNNPQPGCAGNDVTINSVVVVYYRVDGGSWFPANPSDGNYDEPMEPYLFTVSLTHGTHLIETYSVNNLGHLDSIPASDTVTIDNAPNKPTLTGTIKGNTGQQYMYIATATDVDGDPVFYWFDWDDGNNTGWLGPLPPGAQMRVNHSWSTKGTYEVKVKVKDFYNVESSWATLDVTMPKNSVFNGNLFQMFLENHPFLSSLLSFLFERFSLI